MSDLFGPASPSAAPPEPRPAGEAEREALLALTLAPGVGPGRLRALLARFGSAEAVLAAPRRALEGVGGVGPQTAAAIAGAGAAAGRRAAQAQLARAARVGARAVFLGEPDYPALLAHIYDPPPLLWVRGRLAAAEDAEAVAIVGTRRATPYGERVAAHFASGLAARGVTIVSGLAYGIDIAAHRAALEAGGRTVAVLGCGVDRVYPARHAPLVRRLLEADAGAVVSELPLGAAPDAPNFPRRNRLIAGLSRATLVAEAHEGGGALITAFMALEQNRDVFAVPAPAFAEAQGTNRLIREGAAALVTSPEDLLADLGGALAAQVPAAGSAPPDLNAAEARLHAALGPTPRTLDALCAETGLDASSALVYLLSLEFKGLARQLAGKQFFRP
ncbi:MAG: DNA-processing protein DprA [Rubricoccaceae bacterium]